MNAKLIKVLSVATIALSSGMCLGAASRVGG